MFAHVRAIAALVLGTVLLCVVLYPLALWGIGSVLVPEALRGSLIADGKGRVVGSRLIAQSFVSEEYFWPRPSAADYKADASAGSNLGASNPALRERVEKQLAALDRQGESVPADMVTASGSGLDPHITLRNALSPAQLDRVARKRGVSREHLSELVRSLASHPLGSEPLVNVLELNLAVDGKVPKER